MIELLSPAGGDEALRAAVENGADAVYLGAQAFNARRGADNFDDDGLKRAAAYCHERGVRVYVTLNTLVRQDELPALEEQIDRIACAGADAAIVQDLGVAATLLRRAPSIALHASTQMAVHNRQGVLFLREHGFARAVLAREMPLEEIERCAGLGVELEAFCHGALCVSCSGMCLFSSLVGGRSGNRGMCAQPCRLPYRLVDERAGREKSGHLLSTRDLMLLEDLEAIKRAGVVSFKIEGRLKRPEYVAVVTAIYRRALDGQAVGEDDRRALLQIFNRGGFSRGYVRDMNDADLMYARRPNHLGVCVARGGRLFCDVDARDALVERREGEDERPVQLQGAAGSRIQARGKIYRLIDQAQMRAARESYLRPRRRVAVTARLTLRAQEPMRLLVSDGEHRFCAVGEAVERAQTRPTDRARVVEQLQKTGATPYAMRAVEVEMDADAFVSVGALNALRREALEGLSRLRVHRPAHLAADGTLEEARGDESAPVRLVAMSEDPAVLLRAQAAGADEIVLAPRDLRAPALEEAAKALSGARFGLAVPPVADAVVLEGVHAWAQKNAARIFACYLGNIAHLALAWPGQARGGYGLNLCNARAVALSGLARYMPSLELTARQLAALPGQKELLIWGRATLMYLRHCPLRAAWGIPGAHAHCRRCDEKGVRDGAPSRLDDLVLLDRMGARFPLRRVCSQAGCVVEVLNSVPHWLLGRRERLPACSGWVLMLRADEPLEAIVRACRAALDGDAVDLSPFADMRTTNGHIFRGVE